MLIYNTTVINNGNGVSFESDGTLLYVGKDGFLGSTIFGAAVYSNYRNSSAIIDGTVAGNAGIRFNNGSDANSAHVEIGKTGSVYSQYGTIEIHGQNNRIVNAGTMWADQFSGAATYGDVAGGLSIVTNTGSITGGDVGAGVYFEGLEDGRLNNSGVIQGGNSAFNSFNSTGNFTVSNSGTMLNGIRFGEGRDVYRGTSGQVSGVVSGDNGNDTFIGGNSADSFEGDRGRDLLTGAGGADNFIFASVTDSGRAKADHDLISDFSHKQGDQIDLSLIDADETFTFIGSHAFSGAENQLSYSIGATTTMINVDIDGDKQADFAIELTGRIRLQAGDFIL